MKRDYFPAFHQHEQYRVALSSFIEREMGLVYVCSIHANDTVHSENSPIVGITQTLSTPAALSKGSEMGFESLRKGLTLEDEFTRTVQDSFKGLLRNGSKNVVAKRHR